MFKSLDKCEIYKTTISIPDYVTEKVYELKQLDEGTPKTNYGGWHSKTFTPYKDYYNGRYKWTQELIESLVCAVRTKWISAEFDRAWFNLAHQGGNNRWHNHGAHPIVGVLYIQLPEGSSGIEFENNSERFVYTPQIGDFLVFPGSLEHRVLDHDSPIDRISFAINFD
jgi:hypothetical protein